MIKSAASAASLTIQKISKNEVKVAFLGSLYRDSYRVDLFGAEGLIRFCKGTYKETLAEAPRRVGPEGSRPPKPYIYI